MPKRIVSQVHVWDIAALIRVDDREASKATLRGYVDLDEARRIQALEVYCVQCHRPYEAVADQPCAAVESNAHLIGGPTGERQKRVHDHDCRMYGCVRDVEADRASVGLKTGT
jgi:hypothetical protein